jgi:hypothetical protein
MQAYLRFSRNYPEPVLFLVVWFLWVSMILIGGEDIYASFLRFKAEKQCGFGQSYDFVAASSIWVAMWGWCLAFVFYRRHRGGWIKSIGFYERSRGKLTYFFFASLSISICLSIVIFMQSNGACFVGRLGAGLLDQLHSAVTVLICVFFVFCWWLVRLCLSERLNEMEKSQQS